MNRPLWLFAVSTGPVAPAVLMTLLLGQSALAAGRQSDTSVRSAPVAPRPTPGTPAEPKEIRVLQVYRQKAPPTKEDSIHAGLGDVIVVRVQNLQILSNRSKCLGDDGQPIPGCHEQEIVLFLDGRKITGLFPESGAPRPDEERLTFHLQRAPESDEAWSDLLGSPPIGPGFFSRPTEVSVGLDNGYPEHTDVTGSRFSLIRIRKWRFLFGTGLLIAFLYYTLRLARESEMLRDSGPSPKDDKGNAKRKTFSLGRCQMAFWFFWVAASFVFIWAITGASDIITSSALALIGIGAGTSLGAAAIDAGKTEQAKSGLSDLEAEAAALTSDLDPTAPASLQGAAVEKQARLAAVKAQIAALSNAVNPQASRGFLMDVLSDAYGISFHRFQMFVWTVVLWLLFMASVWTRLSMPEFSATLLAMLGISAGTYLGFKIPEKDA